MKIKDTGYIDGDFDLVQLINGTPHCKIHGAMNTMSNGLWRCFTMYYGNSEGNYPKGETPIKFKDRTCKACCVET